MQINNRKTTEEFMAWVMPQLFDLGIIEEDDEHEASRLPAWSTIRGMYKCGIGSDDEKEEMISMWLETLMDM